STLFPYTTLFRSFFLPWVTTTRTLPFGLTPRAVTLTRTVARLPALTFFFASLAVTFAAAFVTFVRTFAEVARARSALPVNSARKVRVPGVRALLTRIVALPSRAVALPTTFEPHRTRTAPSARTPRGALTRTATVGLEPKRRVLLVSVTAGVALRTVSVAAADVTEPAALLATIRYCVPESVTELAATLRLVPRAPATSRHAPDRVRDCHWSESAPVTRAVNVAVSPTVTVLL